VNQRRRELVALAACFTIPRAAIAQKQVVSIPRVGFLSVSSPHAYELSTRVEAMRTGLRDLGYIEGKTIEIDYKYAGGQYERLPELAAELVRTKVKLIVAPGSAARAAAAVTTSIPIVTVNWTYPVENYRAVNLAHPEGNITGLAQFDLTPKHLEWLRAIFPAGLHVALLRNSLAYSTATQAIAEGAAKSLGIRYTYFEMREPQGLAQVFQQMSKQRIDAVHTRTEATITENANVIAALALTHKLPLIGSVPIAEAGGLIGYSVNGREMYRRVSYFVDKILRGASPKNLPMELPSKFDVVINMRTAKAFAIKIPNSIIVQATKVIE